MSEHKPQESAQAPQEAAQDGNGSAALDTILQETEATWAGREDVVVAFSRQLEERWRIAKMIAQSGLTAHKKPEAIMAIQLTAYEMGLPLMTALRGMYYASGKIGMESHLMAALAIQRCGVTWQTTEWTEDACRMVFYREGWEPMEVEYTIHDAAKAGHVAIHEDGTVVARKETYGTVRKDLMSWRCLSRGLKRIAPDHFGGVYTLDEVQGMSGMAALSKPQTGALLDELEEPEEEAEAAPEAEREPDDDGRVDPELPL